MAMMAKMRSLAPAFILSVGVLFVLFMVISDSNVLEALGGRTNDVGSVNGDDISYQEFVNAVDRQVENMKSQSDNDFNEEQMPQIRDQVWDAVVSQKLLEQEIEKFGISVSDDEIRDVILGDNPPDFLKQSFIDSTGRFNRQLYESALFDPRNKEHLVQAEEFVRQSRLNEKLQSILFASITVGEADIKRNFINQNIKMAVEYALIALTLFPDSTVNATEEDLKDYYDKNLDKYKIEAQRKLKYVLFPDSPSDTDSLNVKKILETVDSNLKSDTASFKSYVDIYSTQPYKRDTLSISAFSDEAAQAILKTNPGTIIGPVATPEGYALYNFIAVIPSQETMVHASHILINQNESDSANYHEAMSLYNDLISGTDFGKLAKEKSKDPGSAVKGGDLGWFAKGRMVPEFEKAAFSGEIGVVQKPVKSNFGYHIIKVTGKTDKKFVVEKIVNPIVTSASTRDAIYNEANDFAYVADKNDFEKEAELMNYKIQETPAFVKEANTVPGLGVNKRVVEFAFDNGMGTVSDVFKITAGYAVVMVSEVVKEGIKPFDEVENMIKPLVINEIKYRKAKELAEKIKGKIGNDLNKVANIDVRVKVNKTDKFTSAAGYIPSIGRDFAFIEKAKVLELNKISEPVKGIRGYYLMKVVERNDFDSSSYAIQRNTIRDRLLNEKKNAYFNQWITKAKKDADIVDNRHLFFGQ
jgi:peptidyl-prolyl cis-trans isomerase D